jgi:AraC-like DNA-binding protein
MNARVFQKLCEARRLLGDVAEERLPVEQVARRVGMSRFHFIRQFEALFGMTPHQYRIRGRLDRAKELLARGVAVTDVCLDVGLDSLGSFSDSFSRRIGTAPSDFRKRAREGEDLFPGCLSLMARLPRKPEK